MFRILGIVAVLFLVSCSNSSGTKVDAKNFETLLGSKFFACNKLTDLESKQEIVLVSDNGQDIYLRFKNGGFSGRAPVNLFFGAMKITDTEVKFGDIGATMKAGDEKLMADERKFFAGLNSVDTIKFDEKKGQVFLIKGKKTILSCKLTSEEEMKEKISEALEKRADEVFGTTGATSTTTATDTTKTSTPVVAK